VLIDGTKGLEIYKVDAKFSKLMGRDFLMVYVEPGKIDFSVASSSTAMEGNTLLVDFYARKNFIPDFLWSRNQTTFSDPWGGNIFVYEISDDVSEVKVRNNDIVLWDRNSVDR